MGLKLGLRLVLGLRIVYSTKVVLIGIDIESIAVIAVWAHIWQIVGINI